MFVPFHTETSVFGPHIEENVSLALVSLSVSHC